MYFLLFCVGIGVSAAATLNFIIVTIGDNPSYGYYAAAPYFDEAFHVAEKRYPQVFRNYSKQIFHKPALRACPDAAAAMFAVTGEIYDVVMRTDGFTMLLSPGCSPELLPLGDLAREIDVPLLASTSADPMFANRKRYPTMLTFGAVGQGAHAAAAKAFLKYYKWKTLTLFCDDLLKYTSIAAFLSANCRAMKALFSAAGEFEFYLEAYDSQFNPDYETRLKRAKAQSRVIVILTRADELRKIMIIAHKLGMTDDEFVFLHTIPIQGPEYLPLEIDTGQPEDVEIVFQAYQHLITMSFHLPDYAQLSPFINAVARNAAENYSHPYTTDEKNNEITLAIPELLYAVGKVLNESTLSLEQMTTSHFRHAFLNKSFETGIRRLMIGHDGMRMSNTIYSRLNTTSRRFEPAWYFDFPSKTVSKTSTLSDEWNGLNTPPLNEPVCGFRHDRCRSSNNDSQAIIIGSICGVLVICAAAFGYMFFRVRQHGKIDLTDWWYLEGELQTLGVGNVSTVKKEKSLAWKQDSVISLTTLNGISVWVRIERMQLTQPEILSNSALRLLLAQLRLMRHDNIGQFVGLSLADQNLSIVWEGGRRMLRSVLASETIITDATVQLFFAFNIILGLNYIHDLSSTFFHGSLSSLSVILDSRFTAKITDVASIAILHKLSKNNYARLSKTDVILAPEYDSEQFSGSREADVFALGGILTEILKGPKGVQGHTRKSASIKPGNILMHQQFGIVIDQCSSRDPRSRPAMKNIFSRLSKFKPKGTIVGSLLKKLEEHAENLENVVTVRTAELMDEREKVDALLSEIIPPSLVSALRNKIHVPPETFDSTTIMFSSMVGFDVFCSSSAPVDAQNFLNELYIFMDNQLIKFDAYKVETIKDGYVVASGVPIRNGSKHATEIASLALRLLQNCTPGNLKQFLPIRIGLHTGPIAAGFVGLKMPRYCLFGDTMNTASRMESHGAASKIHVSPDTAALLKLNKGFELESRGLILVKGKGQIETYWLAREF